LLFCSSPTWIFLWVCSTRPLHSSLYFLKVMRTIVVLRCYLFS
jgi:hypothetical protein